MGPSPHRRSPTEGHSELQPATPSRAGGRCLTKLSGRSEWAEPLEGRAALRQLKRQATRRMRLGESQGVSIRLSTPSSIRPAKSCGIRRHKDGAGHPTHSAFTAKPSTSQFVLSTTQQNRSLSDSWRQDSRHLRTPVPRGPRAREARSRLPLTGRRTTDPIWRPAAAPNRLLPDIERNKTPTEAPPTVLG